MVLAEAALAAVNVENQETHRRTRFESDIQPLLPAAFGLALAMLSDRGAAEDAVQEAALNAWRQLDQLGDGRPARPWFMAIVANRCRAMRRGRWFSVLRLAEVPRAQTGASSDLDGRADLQRAIARLRVEDRLVLYLHFSLDLPLQEVADVMGVSLGAAKSRLYRAARRLRPDIAVPKDLI